MEVPVDVTRGVAWSGLGRGGNGGVLAGGCLWGMLAWRMEIGSRCERGVKVTERKGARWWNLSREKCKNQTREGI